MPDVVPLFKENQGECGCGCGVFGTLKRPWMNGQRCVARRCVCVRCRGKSNRARGDAKARQARKQLGLVGANTRHEELWGGPVRTEIKSGVKAKTVQTAYENSRAQSEAARPLGDNRACVPGFAPVGTSHVYYVIRDDELEAAVFALAAAWGYGGES